MVVLAGLVVVPVGLVVVPAGLVVVPVGLVVVPVGLVVVQVVTVGSWPSSCSVVEFYSVNLVGFSLQKQFQIPQVVLWNSTVFLKGEGL